MNTFKEHLARERKESLIRDWQYLKPHQQMWLYLRALWWSLPTITQILQHHRERFNVLLTYFLYKAHWM
jgi:hypothetical protein